MGKLSVKTVQALIKAGGERTQRHADGDGLYLVIPVSGSASWMLRFTSNKKRREMTLGKVQDLSLSDARLEAATKMKQVREGFDPLLQRKRAEQERYPQARHCRPNFGGRRRGRGRGRIRWAASSNHTGAVDATGRRA